MPRFAAIDVGSNALRLRVVEAAAPSQASKALPAPLPEGLEGSGYAALAGAPRVRGVPVRAARAGLHRAGVRRAARIPPGDGPLEGRRLPRHRHQRRSRGKERGDARRAGPPRGRHRARDHRGHRGGSAHPARRRAPDPARRPARTPRRRRRRLHGADATRPRRDRVHEVAPSRDGAGCSRRTCAE